MKRTERHHLKEDELVALTRSAQELIQSQRTAITAVVAAIVVVGIAAGGYFFWQGRVQGKANGLLADAMAVEEAPVGPPPSPDAKETGPRFPSEHEKAQAALTKFKIVADQYPSTDAGIFARLREGATWMALDAPAEAATAYQLVIDRSGSGIYGQMARLGLAEAQARTGQFDQAIGTYKLLADQKDGPLPVDGVLMQLGRTYANAGKPDDAQQAFNRLIQEFPESPFTAAARQALDALKLKKA